MATAVRTYRFTARFEKSLAALPEDKADLFEKKLPLFLENINHRSFRTKKVQGTKNPEIWESSLTMSYRFTFHFEEDAIVFRNVGTHAILDKGKV